MSRSMKCLASDSSSEDSDHFLHMSIEDLENPYQERIKHCSSVRASAIAVQNDSALDTRRLGCKKNRALSVGSVYCQDDNFSANLTGIRKQPLRAKLLNQARSLTSTSGVGRSEYEYSSSDSDEIEPKVARLCERSSSPRLRNKEASKKGKLRLDRQKNRSFSFKIGASSHSPSRKCSRKSQVAPIKSMKKCKALHVQGRVSDKMDWKKSPHAGNSDSCSQSYQPATIMRNDVSNSNYISIPCSVSSPTEILPSGSIKRAGLLVSIDHTIEPLSFLKLILDDEFLEQITDSTNQATLAASDPRRAIIRRALNATKEEILRYFALHIHAHSMKASSLNDNWNDNPYALMARIKGQLHVSRFKRISQYFPNHTDSLDLWREQVLNRCQMLYYPSRELAIYQSAVSSATELASGIAKSYELRDLHGYIYSFGVYKDRTPLEIVKGLANQLWGKGHILQIQTSTKSDPFAYALGEESVTTDTSDVPSINIGRFVEFDIFHSLDHDFKLQDDACLNSLSSVNDEPSQLNPAFYCTPFLRLIDISVHNAFVLYKMSHSELENDFQQFRQQVVQKIFLQYDSNVEIMPFCSHSPTKLMSPRKPCVVCATRGIKRRRTSFYCTSCVTHPSLCFLSKRNCFAEWHGRITEV